MNKMEEMIQALKNKLNNSLTKESSNEEINLITDLNKDLDGIQDEYTKLEKDHQEVKNTLIDYVKRGGDTKTPPEDDTKSHELPSFDEFLKNNLKKKEN